jgi:hypothetical protein
MARCSASAHYPRIDRALTRSFFSLDLEPVPNNLD